MRVNIATIVASGHLGMESISDEDYTALNDRQSEMAVDGEAMSKELDILTQTQASLEGILVGLQDLKKSGKGLSLESAKFVNVFLSDAEAKLGSGKARVSLESFSSDQQRLDIALEGVTDYLMGIIKAKVSGYMWIASHLAEYFDEHKTKAIKLKADLAQAISRYNQSGPTTAETITGDFGNSLLKDYESNPSTSVILSNVKQYASKMEDPAKMRALQVVSDSTDDVIEKIRKNWFFTSGSDVEELEKIRSNMASALRDYDNAEQGMIGQGYYNLTFDDDGAPRLTRAVMSGQKGMKTFKPLSESEMVQFSQELNKICDASIRIADMYTRHFKKLRSLYGFSFVNGILRLGPKLMGMLASLVAGNLVGGIVAAIPSRDILHAMMFTNYMDVLRMYMHHDTKQREKVITDGVALIRRSAA